MGKYKSPTLVNGVKTKEYVAWRSMTSRCYAPSILKGSSKKHQEKGIQVCQRWLDSYDAFYEDMGPAPGVEYSLDRKDNNGDYTPENSRWATATEQSHNRGDFIHLYTYKGETKPLRTWCHDLGVNYLTVWNRLNIQKVPSFEEAISPIDRRSLRGVQKSYSPQSITQ